MAMNIKKSESIFSCSFRTTVKYRDRVFPTIMRTHPRRDRKEGVSCETKFLNVKTILYKAYANYSYPLFKAYTPPTNE